MTQKTAKNYGEPGYLTQLGPRLGKERSFYQSAQRRGAPIFEGFEAVKEWYEGILRARITKRYLHRAFLEEKGNLWKFDERYHWSNHPEYFKWKARKANKTFKHRKRFGGPNRQAKNCLTCGEVFYLTLGDVLDGRRYCSRRCAGEGRRRPSRNCKNCGKLFTPEWHQGKFCCVRCASTFNGRKQEKQLTESELSQVKELRSAGFGRHSIREKTGIGDKVLWRILSTLPKPEKLRERSDHRLSLEVRAVRIMEAQFFSEMKSMRLGDENHHWRSHPDLLALENRHAAREHYRSLPTEKRREKIRKQNLSPARKKRLQAERATLSDSYIKHLLLQDWRELGIKYRELESVPGFQMILEVKRKHLELKRQLKGIECHSKT